MRTITAREANQSFSALLRRVEAGEEIVITRHGTAVARLSPVADRERQERRERARTEMLSILRTGYDLGGVRVNREEIYDRCVSASTPTSSCTPSTPEPASDTSVR